MWLQSLLRHKPKPISIDPADDVLPDSDSVLQNLTLKSIGAPKGHVVKIKHKPDYTLPTKRGVGGRVVRTIPKQLRKMKENAENTDM